MGVGLGLCGYFVQEQDFVFFSSLILNQEGKLIDQYVDINILAGQFQNMFHLTICSQGFRDLFVSWAYWSESLPE